jgi:APA family basic amino acid/polyamine antiporter
VTVLAGTALNPPIETTLVRRLGPFDAAAIVVSNVIGGGIFFVPIIVAGYVPTTAAFFGVWFLGGLLAFAGAMAYAELATLRPHAGGEYVYLRDAYGPIAAFLTGWTSFVAGFSGAIAAGAVALADYIGRFVPAAADHTPLLTLPVPWVELVVTKHALVAISAIVALSLVHFHGSGRIVHNVLAGAKVSAILVFIALGLGWGSGSVANWSGSHVVPNPSTGWLLALVPIMFTYSGWNAAAYVAEEIRNPSRNVPLALGLGTAGVIGIYMLMNALYLFAMPIGEFAALPLDGGLTAHVAERLFGFVAGNVIAIFTIVSIAALISAMVMAGPRVYYAMARDHVFLKSAARVHPRYRTPVLAITAQAVWSSVLVLSGTLADLVTYTGFAVVLFAGVAVLSLFVLRHREPGVERPFKAWGYPIAPGFFVLASAVMVVYEVVNKPGPTLAGVAIIAVGIPVYFLFARRARDRRPS